MFDNDINFLPQEIKAKEKRVREKTLLSDQKQVPYTQPVTRVQKEQPVKIKIRKTNLFKKIGAFLHLFKKNHQAEPKSKKTVSSRPVTDLRNAPLNGKLEKNPKISQPIVKINLAKSIPPTPFPSTPESAPSFSSLPKQKEKEPPKKVLGKDKSPKSSFGPGFTSPILPAAAKTKETGVNLMPEDIALKSELKRRSLVFFVSVFCACVALALAFFSIRLYASSYTMYQDSTKKQVAELEKEIEANKEFQLQSLLMSQKIKLVSDLIKNHLFWSNFFLNLEKVTHADVQYSNFQGDSSGQISLDASSPDFKAFVQQIIILENSDLIKDFEFSGVSPTKESGEEKTRRLKFNLILKFNPQIFYQNQSLP